MSLRATILGCGSSGGVPRLGGDWGACDPTNPKNRRQRCALLIERVTDTGTTRICVDAGPDFRAQMLMAKVPMLDALVISHEHADHIHGIDDMRQFVNLKTAAEIAIRTQDPNFEVTREIYQQMVDRARIDCYAGLNAHGELASRFGYLFERPPGSGYPPIMHLHEITGRFAIGGAGGAVEFHPFAVPHGDIMAYGFKIGDLVYLPDVFDLTDEARDLIRNVGHLIIDCLQFRPHSTHANYDKTMGWIRELAPKHAILTNLHTPLDYAALDAMTPDHVEPAYDGMVISYDV